MPIIHRHVIQPATGPDGKLLILAPPEGLYRTGPRVQVSIGLAQPFAEALLQRGEKIPDPIVGEALIDTGASNTTIDEAIAQRLGLPVVGQVNICSASHESTEKNQYPVRIDFLGTTITSNVLQAPCGALAAQNLAVLVGRDILSQFVLLYNGPMGQWTLVLG